MRRAAPLLVGAALLLLLPLGAIEPRAWLTLTVAGLAMGMLIFLVASGLTLIFGLMDVLNFAHGALFSWGAYAGFTVAVALDARQYDALYNIGLVAADAGRRQQAVKALARFVDTAPAGRFGTEIARARALLQRLGS